MAVTQQSDNLTKMAQSQQLDISVRHPDYLKQYDDWVMMSDLYEGASAVKAKRLQYLPPTEMELKEGIINIPQEQRLQTPRGQKSRYQMRVDRSVFINGIARLVKYAMSSLFREEVILPPMSNDAMKKMFANADKLGTEMEQFIHNIVTKAYVMGHMFVCIDMPKASEIKSLQDQQKQGIHPYLITLDPRQVLSWDVGVDANGNFQLQWVIYTYEQSVSDGPFKAYTAYNFYKVWTTTTWELYRENQQKKGVIEFVESGVNPIGVVPIVGIYTETIRQMVSRPPLLEAGFLNLDHYRTYSGFNNGLMYHLNPVLTFIGVSTEQEVRLNASTAVILPQGADAKYVEYTGGSLKIAKESADTLLTQMMESGLRTTMTFGSHTPAAAIRLARSDFNAFLLSVADNIEFAFRRIFQVAGLWVSQPLSDEAASITMNRDYDIVALDANMAQLLTDARNSGLISNKLWFKEMARGEVISQDLNVDQEIADAKKDGPNMATVKTNAPARGGAAPGEGNAGVGASTAGGQ